MAEVYQTPFIDLVHKAAVVHRMYNDPQMVRAAPAAAQISPVPRSHASLTQPRTHRLQVQRCTLLSIKTGGCPENCNYCSQSTEWSKETGMKAEKLMGLEEVYEVRGSSLLPACHPACALGAWRNAVRNASPRLPIVGAHGTVHDPRCPHACTCCTSCRQPAHWSSLQNKRTWSDDDQGHAQIQDACSLNLRTGQKL